MLASTRPELYYLSHGMECPVLRFTLLPEFYYLRCALVVFVPWLCLLCIVYTSSSATYFYESAPLTLYLAIMRLSTHLY
jgi:hypothetical protein